MNQPTHPSKSSIECLKASAFYQACQNAFRNTTSLPLVLLDANDPQFNPCQASPNQNSFCRLLNTNHEGCQQCERVQELILSKSRKHSFSHTCFAGLEETSVPLRMGEETIGFLKTGQVFAEEPTPEQYQALQDILKSNGHTERERKKIIKTYKQTRVLGKEKYSSMITLLNIISLQLTEFLNRIALEGQTHEPEVVHKAKAIISDRIDEKITLGEIAEEVHVSSFYLCKLFKQSTGMTFTEFVNRQRVELARGELKKTDKPVTEIAYAVGFQSLSQFNRSFLKFAGESPREFRQHARTVTEEETIFPTAM